MATRSLFIVSALFDFKTDIIEFSKSVRINAPVEEVFAFCSSPDGFEKHFPQPVRWLDRDRPLKLGYRFQFEY